MKYLVGNQCINAEHIVSVEFDPAHDESQSDRCCIMTDAPDDDNGYVQIVLRGPSAVLFWEAYIGDAYTVVDP